MKTYINKGLLINEFADSAEVHSVQAFKDISCCVDGEYLDKIVKKLQDCKAVDTGNKISILIGKTRYDVPKTATQTPDIKICTDIDEYLPFALDALKDVYSTVAFKSSYLLSHTIKICMDGIQMTNGECAYIRNEDVGFDLMLAYQTAKRILKYSCDKVLIKDGYITFSNGIDFIQIKKQNAEFPNIKMYLKEKVPFHIDFQFDKSDLSDIKPTDLVMFYIKGKKGTVRCRKGTISINYKFSTDVDMEVQIPIIGRYFKKMVEADVFNLFPNFLLTQNEKMSLVIALGKTT